MAKVCFVIWIKRHVRCYVEGYYLCCIVGIFVTELIAYDLMHAAAECRRLFGGPLNPKFNVCKKLNDGMMKVRIYKYRLLNCGYTYIFRKRNKAIIFIYSHFYVLFSCYLTIFIRWRMASCTYLLRQFIAAKMS